MTPRRTDGNGFARPETEAPKVVAILPSPSDDTPFNDVIESRFRQLFTLCTDAKDLTKALEAATAWVKVKQDADATKGWGESLRGTTR